MTERRHIKLRGGLDIRLAGAPRQSIDDAAPRVDRVAVVAGDYPGVHPALRVEVGDAVVAGQTLFVDRRRPAIAFTAPVAGRVAEIRRGPRRKLDAVVIEPSAAAPPDASAIAVVPAGDGKTDGEVEAEDVRRALLSSGLWAALRTRPYGDIPDPAAAPADILVTAMDTEPLAADARVVIDAHRAAFLRGLDALRTLPRGRLLLCQGPGPLLAPGAITFHGRHPAGLPGTHAQRLCDLERANADAQVWHVGYQDAIAIGHLLSSGRLWGERVIALAGPAVRRPRLIRAPLGARLGALTEGELDDPNASILSGSALSGQPREFLGRHHLQVTALPARRPRRLGPIIPTALLERAAPAAAPVPLLRALSVGDAQAARSLGALAMLEEDVAPLSYACPSGTDYAPLLRNVLDQLRGADGVREPPQAPPAARLTARLDPARCPLRIALIQAAAIVPPLAVALYRAAPAGALWVAVLTALAWQTLFSLLRKRPLGAEELLQALITGAGLAILVPASASTFQVALGASFGVVLAQQVFGGYGFHIVHPVVAALAFLGFSYPAAGYGEPLPLPWLAVLPGVLLLLATGLASFRVLLAVTASGAAALYAAGALPALEPATVGSLAFALVFLGCDPVAAAATNPGRWLYGSLLGALAALSFARGEGGVVLPILVAQVFAPLIDRTALGALSLARRGRRG